MDNNTTLVSVADKRYKRLFLITLAALITTIALLVPLSAYLLDVQLHEEQHSAKSVCLTPACIKAANNILANLNLTADPCIYTLQTI
jgi:hypothetical protein